MGPRPSTPGRIASVGNVALSVILLLSMASPHAFAQDSTTDQTNPPSTPNTESRIELPTAGGGSFLLYLPNDFSTDEAERTWPVIFNFHGLNGQPTIWPFRQVTEENGFIIVGMEYNTRGLIQGTWPEVVDIYDQEVDSFRAVKAYLVQHYPIDEERILIAGLSKGGWSTSMIGEKAANDVAGLIILAGGRLALDRNPPNRRHLKNKPVYIGVGENDINLDASRYGAMMYEKYGADHLIDEYPGLGHEADPDAPVLRAWLTAHGRWTADSDGTVKPANTWFDTQFEEASNASDDIDRHEQLTLIENDPRLNRCGTTRQTKLKEALAELRRTTPIKREFEARRRLHKGYRVAAEAVMRRNPQKIRRAAQGFKKLADQFSDTRAAQLALKEIERLKTNPDWDR